MAPASGFAERMENIARLGRRTSEPMDSMNKDQQTFHLWCAYPGDLLDEKFAGVCASLLSPDEKERMRSFRFERHRREYLAAHALTRIALSQYFPLAPEAWDFRTNDYGKPVAVPGCGLEFSLSHAPGLVVCLISHGSEVGVDTEPEERAATILEVAATVFSPGEMAQFESLGDKDKSNRALSVWTLKEAYVKARGLGLSLPLQRFSLLFGGPEGIRLELDPSLGDDPERWRFCLLNHAGHCIAAMVQDTDNPRLQVWEWRPSMAAATRQADAGERWFPASPEMSSPIPP